LSYGAAKERDYVEDVCVDVRVILSGETEEIHDTHHE
jgi:hypothetical protein